MQAKELFESDDLTGAIAACTEAVKRAPTDQSQRTFLFELLSFAGQWDRAQRQLDALAQQDVNSEWPAQVYGNLLQAERRRERVFAGAAEPEFLLDPPSYAHRSLESLRRLAENSPAEATALLNEVEQARRRLTVSRNGQSVDDLRDADDVLAPFLEVMVIHDYVWVPLEQLRELEVAPPERPRDLIWAAVRLVLADGSQRRGYSPVRYPDSQRHADPRIQLGRLTDWVSSEGGPTRGVGAHALLLGDELLGMLECGQLQIAA